MLWIPETINRESGATGGGNRFSAYVHKVNTGSDLIGKCGENLDKRRIFRLNNLVCMKRGVSAVGSAQHWQCWGHGFKSRTLQNPNFILAGGFGFCFTGREYAGGVIR